MNGNNHFSNDSYQTARSELFDAAKRGHTREIRGILSHEPGQHAAANARSVDGESALMVAAYSGESDDNLGTVRALLPFSDPNARDHDGQTALIHATREFQFDVVEELLPVSDLHARDDLGMSAFDHAKDQIQEHPEIAAEMIELLGPHYASASRKKPSPSLAATSFPASPVGLQNRSEKNSHKRPIDPRQRRRKSRCTAPFDFEPKVHAGRRKLRI